MLVCLFWCIYFLIECIKDKDSSRPNSNLILFFLAATLLYFDHWLFFSGQVYTAGEWSYGVANLCVYPLYYAYLLRLTQVRRPWEVSALLLPALLAVFLFPIGRYTEWMTDKSTFLVVRFCFSIQVVWVLIRGYRLLGQTIRRLDNTYSDDRSRLLRPTHVSLVLFGVTAVVSMVLNLMGRDYFAQDAPVAFPAVIMSVLLYGLGFVAAQTVMPPESIVNQTDDEGSTITDEQNSNVLIHDIDRVMREKMLYTNAGLTIHDLADAVHSNRTYVSNCINRSYGINFSQYIARQRVAYAQLILRDARYNTDKAAIADAIVLSGFSSDQTFYRVFKEQTGTTPLQYRKANAE